PGGERRQCLVARVGRDHGDGLEAAGIAGHGVQHRRVVGAIAAGLDEQRVFRVMRVEHCGEGLPRPRLMRQRAVARTVDIGKSDGVDDVRVAVDDVGEFHVVLAMALVVVGSKRCRAFGSRAIDAASPMRRPVSRPTRAMISWSELPVASISNVSAPSGSTANTRVAICWVRGATAGGGVSYRSSGLMPSVTAPPR